MKFILLLVIYLNNIMCWLPKTSPEYSDNENNEITITHHLSQDDSITNTETTSLTTNKLNEMTLGILKKPDNIEFSTNEVTIVSSDKKLAKYINKNENENELISFDIRSNDTVASINSTSFSDNKNGEEQLITQLQRFDILSTTNITTFSKNKPQKERLSTLPIFITAVSTINKTTLTNDKVENKQITTLQFLSRIVTKIKPIALLNNEINDERASTILQTKYNCATLNQTSSDVENLNIFQNRSFVISTKYTDNIKKNKNDFEPAIKVKEDDQSEKVIIDLKVNKTDRTQYESNINKVYPIIRYGRPAKLGEVPYQVSIRVRLHGEQIYATRCGGAIIGPAKVLSAAHCFIDVEIDRVYGSTNKYLQVVRIVAGDLQARGEERLDDTNGQWRRAENLTYHSKYDFPLYDIAIIFLTKNWTFNSNVAMIPYATKHFNYAKKQCQISGYGVTESGRPSDVLMATSMRVTSNIVCRRQVRSVSRDNVVGYICLQNDRLDAGEGDSGGPLVCFNTEDPAEEDKGLLVGTLCGKINSQTVYLRTSTFSNWIRRNCGSHIQGNTINGNLLILIFYGVIFF